MTSRSLVGGVAMLERRTRAEVSAAQLKVAHAAVIAERSRGVTGAAVRLAAECARLAAADARAAAGDVQTARLAWQKWARLARGLERRSERDREDQLGQD